MLTLNIRAFLANKGIEKPQLFLIKLGIGRTSASHLLNNNYEYINVTYLTKICHALHCTPTDLFTWRENPQYPITENHPLHALIQADVTPLATRLRTLTPAQIKQLSQALDNIEATQ
mgnify:CR=1 FL=1